MSELADRIAIGLLMHKTYSIKEGEINKKWLLIDAEGMVLGRLAAEVAKILRGKHKPTFTPHMDCGDRVVIINAAKVALTGSKSELNKGKLYYRHTGYPGGIKQTTAGKMLTGPKPENVVMLAVKRMITDNPLRRRQMRSLYIYADDQHPHEAQQPEICDLAGRNAKNKVRH